MSNFFTNFAFFIMGRFKESLLEVLTPILPSKSFPYFENVFMLVDTAIVLFESSHAIDFTVGVVQENMRRIW